METDSRLQQDVIHELNQDPHVNSTDILVRVFNGVVILTGSVPGFVEKLAAERAAVRVTGVQGVVDKIGVRLSDPHDQNDDELALAVLDAIRELVDVSKNNVRIKVENGWITVVGRLESFFERALVIERVCSVPGVKGINDTLTATLESTTERMIKARITNELGYTAQADAEGIEVTFRDGEVTLRGSVSNWIDRNSLVRAVQATPGVFSVYDHLQIKSLAAAGA